MTKPKINEEPQQKKHRFIYAVLILFGIFLISSCVAFIISVGNIGREMSVDLSTGNVALIPIKGTITGDSSSSFFGDEGASSSRIIEAIGQAKKNSRIKAVIFEINSPGGSAVASDEIGQAVKELDKPTVAWIREVGASGAYWVASSTDHIVANRMSITGSIGVIGSYLEFPNLLTRFNITYRRLVAGKYKDAGIPYRELQKDEQELFQEKLDKIHVYFIQEVSQNRNLTYNQTAELATGMFYLGVEAKDLGLVDELGGKEEAVHYIENVLKENVSIVVYEKKRSIFDLFSTLQARQAFYMGKGMTDFLAKEQGTIQINT
ncbi:MAG: signal peptide peptidase SppA [Nanoarchaeota archaeon]